MNAELLSGMERIAALLFFNDQWHARCRGSHLFVAAASPDAAVRLATAQAAPVADDCAELFA